MHIRGQISVSICALTELFTQPSSSISSKNLFMVSLNIPDYLFYIALHLVVEKGAVIKTLELHSRSRYSIIPACPENFGAGKIKFVFMARY